ncbi:MAG: hypothetical protein ACLR8L_09915 [Oscillospiraceae bacterium]|jgi:hypothetical protein|nr:MAG TPA: hypothetical protein [Caudoviricetes sp.]
MDDRRRIEALCGVVESLLELIEDEAAADEQREAYRRIMRRGEEGED